MATTCISNINEMKQKCIVKKYGKEWLQQNQLFEWTILLNSTQNNNN